MTYGARVIDSTPPPMNTSPSPAAIACAAEFTAWSPLPQSRLTVSPPTSTGQPGEEQRHPGHVAVVLAGLVRATEDHVLDQRRVDPGAVDDGADRRRREVVGADARQRAAVAPDRRADGLDDPGFAERAVKVAGHGGIVGRGQRGHGRREVVPKRTAGSERPGPERASLQSIGWREGASRRSGAVTPDEVAQGGTT